MKTGKKVLALLLVVCMLVGVPLSVDVLAVGGVVTETSPVTVELAHVVEGKPEWFRGSTLEEGKVLYPIFTNAWMNNNGSSYGVLVAIVNKDNFCYATVNGATMWGASMGWNSTIGSYFIRLTGSLAVDKLPTKLTADQRVKYTSAVDTVAELQMLADDLGGRLVCHIFEKTSTSYEITKKNGLVDSWYSNAGKLKGSLTVGQYGNKSGTASENVFDAAQAPITTYANLLRMTGAAFIEEDGLLRINFNRPIQYGGSGDWRVKGRLCVVDANGYMMKYNESTDTYKSQYEILASANNEDGWVDVGFSMPLETVMSWKLPSSDRYDYKMSAEQIADYRALAEEAKAMGNGYRVVYALEEIHSLYDRGELVANYILDGIWDANKLPMLANSCYRYTASNQTSSKRVNDLAFAEVEYLLENPDITPSDCGNVLSITTEDIYSYGFTVTFDRPMNVDAAKEIYLTYRHSPDMKEEGFWQKSPSYFRYLTEGEGVTYKVVDGKAYSNKIFFQFPKHTNALPVGSGIRFCEYSNCTGSEMSNGMIYAGYTKDENGIGLRANTVGAGNYDLSWTPITVSAERVQLLAATAIENGRIRLSFSTPVALANVDGIRVGASSVTAVADNGQTASTGWTLTVANAEQADNTVTVAADAFTAAYGGLTLGRTATATVDGGFGEPGEDFTADFEENAEYSFMNADTGREITVGDEVDFRLVKGSAANLWLLMTDDGKYVDLTGATPAATTEPIEYLLVKAEHERYQIAVDNAVLRDADDGAANEAVLVPTLRADRVISTGWYLTKKGDIKPLKVMPFGASTVYGTNPDVSGPQLGWRDDLSAALVDDLDRYVFVGSQVSVTTTLDQPQLVRHEGNPGWTIKDINSDTGLYDLADGLRDKYDPDVVLFWCGGNDMVAMGGNGGLTEAEMDSIIDNYVDMLEKLTQNMTLDSNRMVVCASSTPYIRSDMVGLDGWYGHKVRAMVEEMSATMPLAYVDLVAAFNGDTEGGICSDKLHLSLKGDTYVAAAYEEIFAQYYEADGSKKTYGDGNKLQAALDAAEAGETVMLTMNTDARAINSLVVPAGVTLDLNGKQLFVNNLDGFGTVVDNQEGKGLLVVSNDPLVAHVYLQADNRELPLYDAESGGYRFFRYQVLTRGKKVYDNYVKFGVAPLFAQAKAYELLGQGANAGVTFTAEITLVNGGRNIPLTFAFSNDILRRYAAGEGDTITVSVYGMEKLEADATLTLMPVLASVTGVTQQGDAAAYPTDEEEIPLKKLFHGIQTLSESDANGVITENGGHYVAYRFSEERMADYVTYNETAAIKAPYYNCTAGVRLDFYTDAQTVGFDFIVQEKHYDTSASHPTDSFDIYEDGVYQTSVPVKFGNDGSLSYTRKSGKAESRITIVFPNRHNVIMSNFALGNAKAYTDYDMKILMLGASTDQGLFADKPSDSYVERLTRQLNAELVNLSVGGLIYNADLIDDDLNFNPDLILIDLDGNTYYSGISEDELEERMTEYLTRVREIYPLAQITVITSARNNKPASWTRRVANTAYACGASVIIGAEHVNQSNEYWNPDLVHPNSAGFAMLAENMLPIIQKQMGLQ